MKTSVRASWLVAGVLAVIAPASRGQAAAEYRDHTQAAAAWPLQAVRGAHGMVATDEELGSQAGVEILKRGGNAVDSAVAVAFALAVVEPAAGNIGGGGFMLVRLADGRTTFFDYREVAPGKASRNMYIKPDGTLDKQLSVIGYQSVAVPGTVAGLELALKTYGKLKLADVLAPAIHLADDGFPVSEKLARQLDGERAELQQFNLSRRIFLNDGKMFHPGDTFKQPELAATLKRIAKNGAAEFYRGETAKMIVDDMKRMGGLITLEDLAQYQPKVREALHASYDLDGHKWDVITSPPPSSGGVAIIEALNMLRDVPLKGWDDAQSMHMVVETMRRVFADRAAYLSDPDFSKVPVDGLTSDCYAKELVATIDAQHASSSKEVKAGTPHVCGVSASNSAAPQAISLNDGPHTTHFSVVDAAGNAVASTYTLNNSYGSHVTSTAGFLLNDEMDDFTVKPGVSNLFGMVQGEANAISPGKRPLSSMAPTVVLHDGRVFLVLGSAGGPRIITVILETALNILDYGMTPQEAVDAPRLHHQWLPDEILVERFALSADTQALLRDMGYRIREQTPWGSCELIQVGPPTTGPSAASSGTDAAASNRVRQGFIYGASDSRRPVGAAIGY